MIKRLKVILGECAGVDGTSKIIDADTGEEIANVRSISIEAGIDKATVVRLELVGVEVEGEIAAKRVVTSVNAIGNNLYDQYVPV